MQSAPSRGGVVEKEDDDCAYDRDKNRFDVELEENLFTQQREKTSAHKRADETQRNVDHTTLTLIVDDLARDPACDQAEKDPSEN
jgi:hypothetical protein